MTYSQNSLNKQISSKAADTLSLPTLRAQIYEITKGKITMLTYAMDPSMLTPGFTFCAIAVTIEASFATCSRTWSNVSLIKLDRVSSYPSSTGGNVVICSTGDKNMAVRSRLTRDRNVWHFLPHYIFKRPYTIFLKNTIRFHLGEFRQSFWTEPCTDSWVHIPLHPRNELIIFRENCNDGDCSRRIRC